MDQMDRRQQKQCEGMEGPQGGGAGKNGLTPEQRRAVESTEGNLQVIAGAGSGKTGTAAHRVVETLRTKAAEGITPENLMALTFNDEAAVELRERIGRVYRECFGHTEGLSGMTIGTFHAVALQLLKEYVPEMLSYEVMSDVRQALLIDRHYARSGMKLLGLSPYKDTPLYIGVLKVLRESELDPAALEGHPAMAALDAYRGLLREKRALDYDELLYRGVQELRTNEPMRTALSRRIRYLLVDEYQDVSPVQEAFVRGLHGLGVQVCVVGDDDQNIYAWRGSDPAFMLGFADRYPDVTQVPLSTNFRSTAPIVGAARRFIERNDNRLPKALGSGSFRTFERGDLLCREFATPGEEAEWIAGRILALRGTPYEEADGSRRGLTWSDCAVLFRSVKGSAAPMLEALRARNIPYIVSGMRDLFQTAEARAVVGVFEYLTGERTGEELGALWRAADLGLTGEDLLRGTEFLDGRKAALEAQASARWTLTPAPPAENGEKPAYRKKDPAEPDTRFDLQALYLGFLEAAGLREERVPEGRGEAAYYHLGKMSQAVSDFEGVYYTMPPGPRWSKLVKFLRYQALHYYAAGGGDPGHASPDAVRIATVHGTKGLEFPAVFLPCLQSERFPLRRSNGRKSVFDVIPQEAVIGAARYETTLEDERRLFYVGLTRAEKYLACTWAPEPGKKDWYQEASPFFAWASLEDAFVTREPPTRSHEEKERIEPSPRAPLADVSVSFSQLRYWFECPRQFRLRFLYGFNPPIQPAMGYGKSLHDAVTELHRRSREGEALEDMDPKGLARELLGRHFSAPFASGLLKARLRVAAERELERYLRDRGDRLKHLEHVEVEVEVRLPEGMVVRGRIDLIRRTDTEETLICDFKTAERSLEEEVPRAQLHVYALGYRQRYRREADLIEVYNLSEGTAEREVVEEAGLRETLSRVREAGESMRANVFSRKERWCEACSRCDVAGVCRNRPEDVEGKD